MFFFKAQLMPLMYAQRVVNKYLTRCGKETEEAKRYWNKRTTNKNRAPTSYKHTNIYIYIFVILF
jgi:hypothetical protein